MKLTDVSDALWQERRLLERLVFKFDTVTLLVESGRWRWLVLLADETRVVADELDRHQQQWYERVLGGAKSSRDVDPTLESPSPKKEILGEHDVALARLRQEVRIAARAALDALTEHPVTAPVAKGEDEELAVEVFRLALEGLVAVAEAFAGRPAA
jgi:hypothetical protein